MARDIIVIGGSAGAVFAIVDLVRHLPPDIKAALHVVLHLSPRYPSQLPAILERAGSLPAMFARTDSAITMGHILVAPPDQHLRLAPDGVRLDRRPTEHGFRPAIDPLFRSAAAIFGPRVVGVVLSGAGHDSAEGLSAIKAAGGAALVQDPDEARVGSLPRYVLDHVAVDAVLPVAQIAVRLAALASGDG